MGEGRHMGHFTRVRQAVSRMKRTFERKLPLRLRDHLLVLDTGEDYK